MWSLVNLTKDQIFIPLRLKILFFFFFLQCWRTSSGFTQTPYSLNNDALKQTTLLNSVNCLIHANYYDLMGKTIFFIPTEYFLIVLTVSHARSVFLVSWTFSRMTSLVFLSVCTVLFICIIIISMFLKDITVLFVPCACVFINTCPFAGYCNCHGLVHRHWHLQRSPGCKLQTESVCVHYVGDHRSEAFPENVWESRHSHWTPQGMSHNEYFIWVAI